MKKKWTGILASAMALTLVLPTVACNGGGEEKLEGKYSIVSATLDGLDQTESFDAYTATFSLDGALRVVISYYGAIETRNSTYTFDGKTVTEKYGKEKYRYTAEGDSLMTTYVDGEDHLKVTLKKETVGEEVNEVSFESVLFGPDMNDSKIFNYCPAILTETVDGEEIMHIWYCTNKDDGVIMDHIGYRKGVKQDNGKWVFSNQQIVLAPTPGTWDARHTCDPAVIRGNFTYHGTQYRYLMAYLGCTTEDYQKNETGIAVSNAPEGPWIKVDELNPIVPWYDDGDIATEQGKYNEWLGSSKIYWGTGMPALVSIDGAGEVLMFYESTLRGTGIQRWDFSNLDEAVRKFTTSISSTGIVNSVGLSCSVNIPDFAFDPVEKRFYVCGVTNEKNPADVTLTRVNSHSMVAYIENVNSMEEVCTRLQARDYRWEMAGYVGPSDTGFERNHNPGIVRTEFGYIPDSRKIHVVVSTGHNSWNNENIFTYRLHGAIVTAP